MTHPYHGNRHEETKTLSENFPVSLEQRRISLRMGLPISTILEGDAPYERGYHNEEGGLFPPSETPVEEAQEAPAQEEGEKPEGGQAEGFRPGCRQRHLVRPLDGVPVEGDPPRLVRRLRERRPRALPDMGEDGRVREAGEEDGRALRQGARRGRMEVAGDGLQALPRPPWEATGRAGTPPTGASWGRR